MTKTTQIYVDGVWDDETNEELIGLFKGEIECALSHYYIDGEMTQLLSPETGLTMEETLERQKWEMDNPFEALAQAESEKRCLFDLFNMTLRESLEREKQSPKKISPTRMQVERSLLWTNR